MRGLIWVGMLAVLLSGCASAPPVLPAPQRASVEADEQAKKFRTRPDRARVYVYRNTRFGRDTLIGLSVNWSSVGTLPGDSFMLIELPAGPHSLQTIGEERANLDLNVQAGRNYYVQLNAAIDIKIGKLELVERHALEAQYAIQNSCFLVLPQYFAP